MGFRGWSFLLLSLLALGAGGLFWVQNSLRLVDLSLDLYFFAFKLREPVPLPSVLMITFGLGLLTGMLFMLPLRGARRSEPPRSGGAGGSSPGGDLWT